MKLQYLDLTKASKDSKAVKLTKSIFDVQYNESLVHQVVTAYLEQKRSWSKQLKSRSDVRGGGAKPWRQKGTGRARAGTSRSPLWRSGGVTFAHTHDKAVKKNTKKMYRGAIKSILSELVRQERLILSDEIKLKSHKTKDLSATFEKLELSHSLIINTELDNNLILASRNIPNIKISTFKEINPYDLVKYQNVVISEDSIKKIEEWLV